MARASNPKRSIAEMHPESSSTNYRSRLGPRDRGCDVTNPAAKHDKKSPLYGMPILEVDRARAIIVMKRSIRPGLLEWTMNCIATQSA